MFYERADFNLNNLEMEITDSAAVILDKSWNSLNVCDPFSRLYYIKSGNGYLKQGEKIIELKSGNIYLIPASTTFSYGCEYLEKIFFHISITKTEKYDLLSDIKTILSLPFSENEYNAMKKLYLSDNYIDKLTLKTIIYKTLSDFADKYHFSNVPIKAYSEHVKRTMNYIHKHTKINLSVKDISKQLFISESKIRKTFKEEVGVTVGEYIDDLVFIKAKKLLKKKYILIGEISEKLGFCDQFYFSRRFKEKFGKTPSEYRKETII